MSEILQSGFAAVVGRPSSGKSSFLNTLCEYKVSIVSPVPQTTRNCIRAIYTDNKIQLVFVDTPGMHISARAYNRRLSRLAEDAITEADVILCLLDLARDFGEEEKNVLTGLRDHAARTVLACNKADLVTPEGIEKRTTEALAIITPHAVMSMSAFSREDVVRVAHTLGALLPEGPRLYPEEYYTDQTQRHRIAEVIREKIFLNMKEEIPHASCVLIEELSFIEKSEKIRIRAVIYVESESQKGIIIGKNGRMIRDLGISARAEIGDIFGFNIDLFLRAEVRRGWRKDKIFLRRLEQQYLG
jgi:GTP-binding protein Era